MHDADALSQLFAAAKAAGAYVIADEVMTGFGRTGTLFACDQLSVAPDMICLSKGLTGGTLPMAVTLCTDAVYDAFYSDDVRHALYHGHSYTANPIACAAALASLDLLLTDECAQARAMIADAHRAFADEMTTHAKIENVRTCGTILAMIIRTSSGSHYLSQERDRIYHYFLNRGVLLRPIGNVLYLIPPYCISAAQLQQIYAHIRDFLQTDGSADLNIV